MLGQNLQPLAAPAAEIQDQVVARLDSGFAKCVEILPGSRLDVVPGATKGILERYVVRIQQPGTRLVFAGAV